VLRGRTFGALASGKAASADSTQIEVAFRKLEQMCGDAEKQPGGKKGFMPFARPLPVGVQ
jgi:hypothetical protein